MLLLDVPLLAGATTRLVRVSSDPYTNPSSQHATEVEADTFAWGSTVVAAFQAGRFFNGGATNNGWATSVDAGSTWVRGFLPGTTTYVGGPHARVSDPSVAYDARHDVWMISSLTLRESPFVSGSGVIVSRSRDGLAWEDPVVVATGSDLDKNWTVCDNSPGSPHYGNCYTQWDDHANGNLIQISTSTDGGLSWGSAKSTADLAAGLAGQPLVKPNGVVIVPIANANVERIFYFRSRDGGASWSGKRAVASIKDHQVAGGLRALPIPSAEIDGAGTVYVVWHDCRFRATCSANDIVMATIKGRTVSRVSRIPIDPVDSGIDHFIPGLGVDRTTSKSRARLGLTYHYYPASDCGLNCQLHVGFISSTDGGTTWSDPIELAGPMHPTWLADTTRGRMVGDYISTSFVADGSARTVFAVANPPAADGFDEAMYSPLGSLVRVGVRQVEDDPVVAAAPDHPPRAAALTSR